jgi:hypothetical protein
VRRKLRQTSLPLVLLMALPAASGPVRPAPERDGLNGTVAAGFARLERAGIADAFDDATSTPEDTPRTILVLANDIGVPPLKVIEVDEPDNGTAAITSDSSAVVYTPDPNFNDPDDPDEFQYRMRDGAGDEATADVSVTVTPVNDPPVATITNPSTNVTIQAGQSVTFSGTGSDVEDPNPTLSWSFPGGSPASGNGPNPGSVRYDTPGNYPATLTVTDDDGAQGSASRTVTVQPVLPLNQPPDAQDDADAGAPGTPVRILVLANDSDPDGDPITISGASQPANGTRTINADGTITYTSSPSFVGTDSFTYTISDGRGGSDTATVRVTVQSTPANRPPVAANDAATTPPGVTVRIPVLQNDSDPDGDALGILSVSQPGKGSATINADRTISYTPNPDTSGGDAFTYTISDGRGGTASATVNVTVSAPANQAPNARIDSPFGNDTIPPGGSVSFTGTGTDPDGTIVSYLWTFEGGDPPTSSARTPGSVTFSDTGDHRVTFNVTDDKGAADPTPDTRIVSVVPGGGASGRLNVESQAPGSAQRVDGHDVIFVLRAIASQDPRADVNRDGRVDQADVQLVLDALGDTP